MILWTNPPIKSSEREMQAAAQSNAKQAISQGDALVQCGYGTNHYSKSSSIYKIHFLVSQPGTSINIKSNWQSIISWIMVSQSSPTNLNLLYRRTIRKRYHHPLSLHTLKTQTAMPTAPKPRPGHHVLLSE